MNRYRAILIDPEDQTAERPKQCFGSELRIMKEWAEKIVTQAVGASAHVDIFETKEVLVYGVKKPASLT